jgi:DNA polymerase V
MLMHIDGNSFYASCERIFRPDLHNKPIAVLSNNDGIIIALNRECKDLGFNRGDVYFKIKARLSSAGVAVFSSNYTLYADMSSRMNAIYNRYAPRVEFYSIDESFLFFPDWHNTDYALLAKEIRDTVKTETGMPVSAGVAPSKTLAKLCNTLAKKSDGVCDWAALDHDKTLSEYPVKDIWGIGWSKAALLEKQGVLTALDLKHYPLWKAKKFLTVSGYNTVRELHGVSLIDRNGEKNRQTIMVSKSFLKGVYTIEPLIAALAEYTQEAVKRLRDDSLECGIVSVYAMYTQPGGHCCNAATQKLARRTSYFPEIQSAAARLLRQIFRTGYKYRKVMILLLDVTARDTQLDLFEDPALKERQEQSMKTFDAINEKYGRGALHLASYDLVKEKDDDSFFKMQRTLLSPYYTTRITDIPCAV